MFKIESFHQHMQLFVFDFEFIGNVKNPSSCKLWDICIHHIQSGSTFNAIIDPIPGCNIFPTPPSSELFHITRSFLDHNNAPEFSIVFNKMVRWVENRCFKSHIPILISHNNFSSDKLVLEHECKLRGLLIPINWLFFDSLIYFRDFTTTINKEYSLKSLVKCILGKEHLNAHRAYADTIALTNVIGSLNILESVRKNNIKNLIYITSDKCYLNKDEKTIYLESDRLGGEDLYSASMY